MIVVALLLWAADLAAVASRGVAAVGLLFTFTGAAFLALAGGLVVVGS